MSGLPVKHRTFNPKGPGHQKIFSFDFNHVKEFLGVIPVSKNSTLKKVIPLNSLPFLGVAEENQQDLVIYGGHSEL